MEQDFGERLKKYRKEKNLTQQDLADQLQVSNKTVSRWESGGGYPDIPLLVPLAKALGVTVDDLLDDEKPVRSLTKADGQNLLSFAFAIGGGALFYLADLFIPTLVCYLAYLGCLAYGVYLQRYYCYQSRWFRVGCAVMNLCVNTSVLIAVAALPPVAMGWMGSWLTAGPNFGVIAVGFLALFLVALLLTGITMALVEQYGFGNKLQRHSRLRLKAPGVRGVIPPVCIALIPLFYGLFLDETVAERFFQIQGPLYLLLVGVSLLTCVLLALKKGHRVGFIAVGVLLLAADVLPSLGAEFAWIPNALVPSASGIIEATPKLSPIYDRFYAVTPALAAAAVVFALLALLPGIIKVKDRERPEE